MENKDYDLTLDKRKQFEILLDCMITSISKSHALAALIIASAAGNDKSKQKMFMELFEQTANEQRLLVIDDLYKLYGWLPPDILEQLNQEPES
jgi:predicted transcriptional regulator